MGGEDGHRYRKVFLITGGGGYKWEVGDKPCEWATLFLRFWFPKQKVIVLAQIAKCLECFTKPMQMNLLSHMRERA